jgi:LPXTG-site transpeptidase (sortase) family protein
VGRPILSRVTEPEHARRRRHRRTSPLRRVARFLGIDRSRPRAALLIAAVLIAVVGLAVAVQGRSPDPGIAASPSPAASATSRPSPSSTLPAVATPTPVITPSPAPVGIVAERIRIERLGINLRIVEGDGVDAPINKAAHFPGTNWPDGGSNIYIYAHAQEGMFLALWDAKVGDEVVLDLVDGTSRRYLVTQVKRRVPWNALEYLEPTPTEQLTLQTSTSYTPTAPRFVVIAEPAP